MYNSRENTGGMMDQTLPTRGSRILESTSTTISALLNENHQFLQEMVIVCILFTAII